MHYGGLPFDSESRHSWFLGEDIPLDAFNDWLRRWLVVQLLAIVFIVDVVSDSYELAVIVGARKEDHCDAKDLAGGNLLQIWGIGLKDEFVDAYWNRANEERVELLVVLRAGCRADISELPFEIYTGGERSA